MAALRQEEWQKQARKAVKDGRSPPPRPAAASDEPHVPRLFVNDATVERLGVILAGQPRGGLLIRDELAGWLTGMNRYNGGGSDRPFWIEAYGGRSFTVERVTRAQVRIDHLSIGIVGNIQPDRLASLLLKADDDGMLARFCPFCPLLSPLKKPENMPDAAFAERAFGRLYDLAIPLGPNGVPSPGLVPFNEDAQDMLQAFREQARRWETAADGLLLSFIGKTPGLAVRLALVFAFLDWAASDDEIPPTEIDAYHFGRASHLRHRLRPADGASRVCFSRRSDRGKGGSAVGPPHRRGADNRTIHAGDSASETVGAWQRQGNPSCPGSPCYG